MARAPDARTEQAKELFLSGRKLTEIARLLNVPEGTVRSWKNRYQWDCNVANGKRNVAKKNKGGQPGKQKVSAEVSQVTKNPDLTDKQRLFCVLYIRCFNATKAYQKAYGCSYETALTNGPALLGNTRIKNEIQKLKQHRLNREMLDENDIFQRYMDIAFADITDFVEFGQEQVPVISNQGPVEIIDPKTGEKHPLMKTENTIHFKEHTEVDGTLISEIKQGKNGVSIKLLDRMKALQWLADHKDLATEEQKLRIEKLKKSVNIHTDDNEIEVQIYFPDNGRDDK